MSQRSVNIIEPTEEEYCQYIDELYAPVNIGYATFYPSQILSELDPIAFQSGYYEFANENLKYECENCQAIYEDEDDALHCSCHDEEVDDE